MLFAKHSEVEGAHAFLGASKHHWINYDIDKMSRQFENRFAAMRGTQLHALAAEMIRLKVKAQGRHSFALFVNDAIGFRMTPEQVLFVSYDCFGTADAISYDTNKRILRIHDLKTGVHVANMNQCYIYAAFFCIEYKVNPFDIEMILRIYQGDEVFEEIADPAKVKEIMDTIELFSGKINEMREVIK